MAEKQLTESLGNLQISEEAGSLAPPNTEDEASESDENGRVVVGVKKNSANKSKKCGFVDVKEDDSVLEYVVNVNDLRKCATSSAGRNTQSVQILSSVDETLKTITAVNSASVDNELPDFDAEGTSGAELSKTTEVNIDSVDKEQPESNVQGASDVELSKTTEVNSASVDEERPESNVEGASAVELSNTTSDQETVRIDLGRFIHLTEFRHVVLFEWQLENFSTYDETIHSPPFVVSETETCKNEWKATIKLEERNGSKYFELFFSLQTQPKCGMYVVFDLGLYNSRGISMGKDISMGGFWEKSQERSCISAYRPGTTTDGRSKKVELYGDKLVIKGRIGFAGCCSKKV